MKKFDELNELVKESRQEHQQVKELLAEMDKLAQNDGELETLETKMEELMEMVEHHAEDEEEGEMFPKIRELMDQRDLEDLGDRLKSAKHA